MKKKNQPNNRKTGLDNKLAPVQLWYCFDIKLSNLH